MAYRQGNQNHDPLRDDLHVSGAFAGILGTLVDVVNSINRRLNNLLFVSEGLVEIYDDKILLWAGGEGSVQGITWEGADCPPGLRAGEFWMPDPDGVVDSTLNFVRVCVPVVNQPGYCEFDGTVELADSNGDSVTITVASGVLYEGDGTTLYTGTLISGDAATGEPINITVVDGVITSPNVAKLSNQGQTASGDHVYVRVYDGELRE